MRPIILILAALLGTATATAQTQRGLVKTKGRLTPSGQVLRGHAIAGVSIQLHGRNAVQSHANGQFSFPVPARQFYIEHVTKQGYVLTDPDVLARQYTYSPNPLTLVMETPDEQLEEQLELMTRIRNSLQQRLQRSREEVKALRQRNAISQADYQKRLMELVEQQNQSATLVNEMVERYSKTDFDQVDEFNRRVSTLILNGDIAEADSLLRTKGDIHARVEQIAEAERIESDEERELTTRRKNLEKSRLLTRARRNEVAQDCYHYFELFNLRHQPDSALYYLETRSRLDTTNVEWLTEAGHYARHNIGNYRLALDYHQRAARNAIAQYGADSQELAATYNDIASNYAKLAEFDHALQYHQLALDILSREDLRGQRVTSYNGMGMVYDAQGDYAKAMQCYEQALLIGRDYPRENIFGMSAVHNNLGVCYITQGNYEKALEYLLKGADLIKEHYGEHDPMLAGSYTNIGNVYYFVGDLDHSMEYQQKALSLMREVTGELYPDMARCYIGIGNVYYSKGDYEQAISYNRKAMAIQQAIYGEHHVEVSNSYNNIGYMYYLQGKYDEAIKNLGEALTIRQTQYGEQHAEVAQCYDNLGMAYVALGDYDRGFEVHSKSLAIRLQVQGSQHPDLAWPYLGLGDVKLARGAYDDAISDYQKAYTVRRDALGEKHPMTVACQEKTGLALLARHDNDGARAILQKVLESYREVLGDSHPDTKRTENQLKALEQ